MNTVIYFDQADAGLVGHVGGKGSNLVTLTGAGFPVPPGFIVTAGAYEQYLATVAGLDDAVAAFAFDDLDKLRDQCERLRARLHDIPLPRDLQDAIGAALSRFEAGAAFAVRSSSTFEDLAQAAFAGQHDTFLNVRGVAAIVERVRDCFASLWQDRAVAYRHRQGFSQKEARMAVVVQRQIACERAGVGFSIQPISGRLDRLVIDANYGLGESVVAGECEIDHFELNKESLAIEERMIGHKDKMIAATADGVEERHVAADQADVACLSDEQVRTVAMLLKQVEGHYGWPQDIEWGWQGGKLYLFQARPVTTFLPRWTRDESAERFPRPMTPLSWDFLSVAFRKSLAHSLALMGLPPFQGDWFQWFDHYIYGNQNAVELIASYRPLRARSRQELIAEIPALRRRYGWVLELPVRWARDLDRYLIRLGQLSSVPLDQLTIPQTIEHINRILEVATDYFQPNIAISMTQAFLHRLLHALVGMVVGPEKALAVVDALLAGCETKTAVVNRELHEMAQLATRHFPAVDRALRGLGGEEFLRQGKLAESAEFAARFQRFLEDHGHREMDMDYYHATWSDQPVIVLDALTLILAGNAEDPGENARKQRLRYADMEQQFLGALPDELRFFFREMIRMARTYTALDDLEHYQTTRINPLARRAALALGRKLQAAAWWRRRRTFSLFARATWTSWPPAFPTKTAANSAKKPTRGRRPTRLALSEHPPGCSRTRRRRRLRAMPRCYVACRAARGV